LTLGLEVEVKVLTSLASVAESTANCPFGHVSIYIKPPPVWLGVLPFPQSIAVLFEILERTWSLLSITLSL
jgi:hypothetical protein